jgi:hypothetical protein
MSMVGSLAVDAATHRQPRGALARSGPAVRSHVASAAGLELATALRSVIAHYLGVPVSRATPSLAEEFAHLARRWREDTRFVSASHGLVEHWAYQRIIGLGPDVVPLVLEELRGSGGQWFWALRALTGVDPVRDEQRGDVSAMREAWLDWGRRAGLIR